MSCVQNRFLFASLWATFTRHYFHLSVWILEREIYESSTKIPTKEGKSKDKYFTNKLHPSETKVTCALVQTWDRHVWRPRGFNIKYMNKYTQNRWCNSAMRCGTIYILNWSQFYVFFIPHDVISCFSINKMI